MRQFILVSLFLSGACSRVGPTSGDGGGDLSSGGGDLSSGGGDLLSGGGDLSSGGGGDLSGGGECSTARAGVTLSKDVQPIFGARCAGLECHGNFFSTGHSWMNLVGQHASECSDGRSYVKVGDPTDSYVYQKITGVGMCSGERMPRFGTPLSDNDVRTIHDWICDGAPNN
jgi:hypothetical protein